MRIIGILALVLATTLGGCTGDRLRSAAPLPMLTAL
jgi:hypothetical protein